MTKYACIIFCLFILLANTSLAMEEHLPRLNAISLKVGYAMYIEDAIPMDYWMKDTGDFDGAVWGAAYERRVLDHLRIEVEVGQFYNHAKYADFAEEKDVSQVKLKNAFFSLTAKYGFPIFSGTEIYAGIGPDYYYTETHYEYALPTKDYSNKDTFNSFGGHVNMGIEYIIMNTPHKEGYFDAPLGLFFEYKASWVPIKDADKAFIDDLNATTSTSHGYHDKNVGTQMFLLGLKWHF